MKKTLSQKAAEFAKFEHAYIRQYYGKRDYIFHLELANEVGKRFSYLLSDTQDFETISAGIYCHDLIEDSHRVNYNTLKKHFGASVAEIGLALQESGGRDRKERHDEACFLRLASTNDTIFVKLCDNIANVVNSLYEGSTMFQKYREEYSTFKKYLYRLQYAEMFLLLESLYKEEKISNDWKEFLDKLTIKYPEVY